MDRRSNPLSSEDRGVILAEDLRGSSQRAIGARLGRAASTIGRELARGREDDGADCPQSARQVYDVRRIRCRRGRKLACGGATHSIPSCTAISFIGAGLPSRLRRDFGSCIWLTPLPASAMH